MTITVSKEPKSNVRRPRNLNSTTHHRFLSLISSMKQVINNIN